MESEHAEFRSPGHNRRRAGQSRSAVDPGRRQVEPIRILVVDDERTLRESCASVLEMDGFSITVIGRGEGALEAVKRRKFAIMLVDLYMSQVSGWTSCAPPCTTIVTPSLS